MNNPNITLLHINMEYQHRLKRAEYERLANELAARQPKRGVLSNVRSFFSALTVR